MKNLLVILSLIAIFAACKKESLPINGVYYGCHLQVTRNDTLNIRLVEDCSMRPLAIKSGISGPGGVLKLDSFGSYTQNYQRTGSPCTFNNFSYVFEYDSTRFGLWVTNTWGQNESLLIVKNDSIKIDVTFNYNPNTVALLKDSIGIETTKGFYRFPELKKDTTFNLTLKNTNTVYRKATNGGYFPTFDIIQFFDKNKLRISPPNVIANINAIKPGICGTYSVLIK